MKLTTTFSADGAAILSTGGDSSIVNPKPGVAGIITSVRIASSADTSVAVVIADATGTVFTIVSTDFTTAVNYEYGNAAIVRASVTGQLTATITGLGSGTFTVSVWIKKNKR